MFNPLPSELAQKYALDFIESIESKNLFSDFTGMFGILVCKKNDESSNDDFVILKAFSGQYKSLWNLSGFVPALVNQKEYDEVVAKNDLLIHQLSVTPKNETLEEKNIRDKKRLALCNETLSKIYSLYKFTCFDGSIRDFKYLNLFLRFNSSECEEKLLPTGTGDCTAPKLFSYAYSKKLQPISLAEFYWGKANSHFEHKKFYAPCSEKCRLILPTILGLEIIYHDKDIIVVNKQTNLLAVPGRGIEKQDCIVNRVKQLFTYCIEQPSVHRLDMDTSGLLVLAFTTQAQRALSIQFQDGKVEKKYIAVIDGVLGKNCNFENKYAKHLVPKNFSITSESQFYSKTLIEENSGKIELKCRLDINNRPHQIYDEEFGKLGITLWKKLRIWKKNSRNVTSIEFTPLTGRTHQLRLAAASPLGFGIPIVGDNLYGIQNESERLLLHSSFLSFTHPETLQKMTFECEPDFKY